MPRIRLLTITVTLLVAQVPAACGFDDVTKVSTQDIPIDDAVRKINGAAKWAHLPASLVPLEATAHQTTAPIETDTSISLAFKAPLADVDTYLTAMHARKDYTLVRPANDCPPAPSGQTPVRQPPPPSAEMWSDSGVFERCAAVEQWQMYSDEWTTRGTTVGTLYRQAGIHSSNTGAVNVFFTLSGHKL
ncbi:hypothetical protein EHH44_11985 [Mycolicibacter terrae]|uniref:Uncharacterized protein n=2 Tax=Mycolicibacter TaxID=1073531 RepID=A0A1A2XM91_MYCSD|nr:MULTISPECIES: hypothetical protein [Mycolicibacter]OBH16333.1 hypothetical protein A5694_06800 [Mycolicibacter sinensis]OBI26845.1 hypothetical protein A5710_00460 [Mycolicibacter sinensis]RRR44272.1 hypothetical protein EHH44_11985 [Mycolicibacter terrae]